MQLMREFWPGARGLGLGPVLSMHSGCNLETSRPSRRTPLDQALLLLWSARALAAATWLTQLHPHGPSLQELDVLGKVRIWEDFPVPPAQGAGQGAGAPAGRRLLRWTRPASRSASRWVAGRSWQRGQGSDADNPYR
jgi:hypothetical protein